MMGIPTWTSAQPHYLHTLETIMLSGAFQASDISNSLNNFPCLTELTSDCIFTGSLVINSTTLKELSLSIDNPLRPITVSAANLEYLYVWQALLTLRFSTCFERGSVSERWIKPYSSNWAWDDSPSIYHGWVWRLMPLFTALASSQTGKRLILFGTSAYALTACQHHFMICTWVLQWAPLTLSDYRKKPMKKKSRKTLNSIRAEKASCSFSPPWILRLSISRFLAPLLNCYLFVPVPVLRLALETSKRKPKFALNVQGFCRSLTSLVSFLS